MTAGRKGGAARMSDESIHAARDVPGMIGAALGDRIQEQGLERNVTELNVQGYTTLPAVAPPEFFAELRAEILELAAREERRGERTFGFGPHTRVLYGALGEIPLVEQALLNPLLVTLMTYLLGDGYGANIITASVFRQGSLAGPVHSDNEFQPEPFPSWATTATAVWCCDEFTEENGSTHIVPGSHRLHRHPRSGEAEEKALPIQLEAGSLVLWNGNTWHSSGARSAPGERVALHTSFCRLHVRSLQSFHAVPQEVLDRNPPELALLLGLDSPFGFSTDGPDAKAMARAKARVQSPIRLD